MAQERPRVPASVLWEALEDLLAPVVRILTAVSCCMLLVIATIKLSPHFLDNRGIALPYTPLPDTDGQQTFNRTINAVANALLMLGVIITTTVLMVALYYYRFYAIIEAWITLACAAILVMSPLTYMDIVFRKYNVPADIFSVGFFVHNFMALGIVAILDKGPLLVQQFYLIVECSFMSIMLIKFLPAWTLWVVLCFISIWDVVAVLAVVGPLRILIEMAKERRESLQPGLFFATGTATRPQRRSSRERRSYGSRTSERRQFDVSEGPGPSTQRPLEVRSSEAQLDRRMSNRRLPYTGSSSPEHYDLAEGQTLPSIRRRRAAAARAPRSRDRLQQVQSPLVDFEGDSISESVSDDEKSQGIKMGLGDFVLYSVLVGKVSTFGDWTIVFACFVGILTGICVTLFILNITRKALPALPVSMALGLIFVGFQGLIQSLTNELFAKQALI
ncbi:hypothetical protein MTO96_024296 [Rhipicephalus appendiculatus]